MEYRPEALTEADTEWYMSKVHTIPTLLHLFMWISRPCVTRLCWTAILPHSLVDFL